MNNQSVNTATATKLSPQIEKQPHHQGFSYLRDSSDGKYHVYAYQILSGGTPAAVKAKFGKQYPSAAKSLDTLLVTDSKGNIYPPHTHFKADTTIYLKQPKVPSTQKRKNSRV